MIAVMRKIRRRSVGELGLLLAAVALRAALLVLLPVARFATLRRTGSACARVWSRGVAGGASFEHRVAWAVATAAVLLPAQHTCLPDALSAHWLLEAGGCRSTIRFGVTATPAHPLRAHAWVEAQSGIVVGAAGAGAVAALE